MSDRCPRCGEVPNPDGLCACPKEHATLTDSEHDSVRTFKHTLRDAKSALYYITMFGSLNPNYRCDAKLIGSFGKGKESDHDIDILLPDWVKKTVRLKNHLKLLLNAETVEDTDWGGWYFHDTNFGDVDVFFKAPNEELCSLVAAVQASTTNAAQT